MHHETWYVSPDRALLKIKLAMSKPRGNTTSGLLPPSWKMAASMFFNVYGPSGVPTN